MKSKSFLIIGICILFFLVNLKAQDYDFGEGFSPPINKEKIEIYKISYLTKEMDLTPDEAQKFWPLYNQFQKDRNKLLSEKPKSFNKWKQDLDKLTDKEIEEICDEELIFAQKMLDLRKKYYLEFKKILPPKKVMLYLQAERNFKRELLKKMKHFKHLY